MTTYVLNTTSATTSSIFAWGSQAQQVNPIVFVPPEHYLLGDINSDWRISQPLLINIEKDDDGSYVVSDDIFGVYGNGKSLSEAKRDYVLSLIEYYEILSSHPDEDSQKLLERVKVYLRHE